MFAIAIPAGLLIGLSLGALGGGGSILTVPALVYLLHQQPHAATTGSLIKPIWIWFARSADTTEVSSGITRNWTPARGTLFPQ